MIVSPFRALWLFTDKIVKSVFEAFFTVTEIAYSAVTPLAAVTFTEIWFCPVRRAPLPITDALAPASVGIATTSTDLVPKATSIT